MDLLIQKFLGRAPCGLFRMFLLPSVQSGRVVFATYSQKIDYVAFIAPLLIAPES
jgi:hypothetical protein